MILYINLDVCQTVCFIKISGSGRFLTKVLTIVFRTFVIDILIKMELNADNAVETTIREMIAAKASLKV